MDDGFIHLLKNRSGVHVDKEVEDGKKCDWLAEVEKVTVE